MDIDEVGIGAEALAPLFQGEEGLGASGEAGERARASKKRDDIAKAMWESYKAVTRQRNIA